MRRHAACKRNGDVRSSSRHKTAKEFYGSLAVFEDANENNFQETSLFYVEALFIFAIVTAMNDLKRNDGRTKETLRPITIETGRSMHAEGSAFITVGDTQVLCLATVEEKIPFFLRDTGKGWVTAEYAMLPRATTERTRRERRGAGGRTMEIQRLIGRSLRAVVDLHRLGERSITVDCDVLQADGGTRCASITGAYVAMSLAIKKLIEEEKIAASPIKDHVAAISVGIVEGKPVLDLDYSEDSTAHVDMNIVMTGGGKFVEIQGTAEEEPFSHDEMSQLIAIAQSGLTNIFEIQEQAIKAG